ncbi:MAG TPA: alginate lyase family protein [Pyrinomonadaceae bacterium]|jgi:hypothetical protein
MNRMWSKLKKLRGRSLDEVRVRGRQSAAAFAERRSWSSQTRVPSDAEFFKLFDGELSSALQHAASETAAAAQLLAHFRTRHAPVFFPSFDDVEKTDAVLRERFATRAVESVDENVAGENVAVGNVAAGNIVAVEESVVERAERIVEGRFDLLGFRNLDFGNPIDWHLEPVAKRRAPLAHWSRIDYLNAEVAGDKKITWELNRQQYLSTLGRAYRRTRDERYAETFVAHLDAWMNANPPKMGINWASSLEVSFRAIAWLWALYFFRDSPRLQPAVFVRALKFLYLHARHLETYLSTYFSPNTHLTGEALGLFYLGTLWPEFRRAAQWRATGASLLETELERHILPDGVYFEQTSYYQRYTTDFYTHYVILARANGHSVDAKVKEKLAASLDHLTFITRPDGRTPLYGDDDGGRLAVLDERGRDDFRATLATGAALFGRADYKYVAREVSEETFWLLGRSGLEAFDRLEARPPDACSRAFPVGGYYVMRDGWNSDSNFLLLDAGRHGALNCGHAHADALSFELAARGRSLLIDPGTYTYTADRRERDRFRSSPMHNTLSIDGESSSVAAGAFSWSEVANVSAKRWLSHKRFDFFEGAHDGYRRLDETLDYTRAVLFLKNDYWIMRDRVASGAGKRHVCELHFHFVAESEPSLEMDDRGVAVRERRAGAAGLEIFASDGQGRLNGEGDLNGRGEWREERGFVSRCYGRRESAPVLTFKAEAEGTQEFFTFLIPRAAAVDDGRKARIRALAATGGRSFQIADVRDGRRDVLLARDVADGAESDAVAPESEDLESSRFVVESEGISSDFELAWVRFGREGSVPDELVLLGGRRLWFEGQELVNLKNRAAFVVARRSGDRLIIETDTARQVKPLRAEALSVPEIEDDVVEVEG